MSHAPVVLLLCACAIIASSGVNPAPPKRAESGGHNLVLGSDSAWAAVTISCEHIVCRKEASERAREEAANPPHRRQAESAMVQEKSIVIRRVPNAYFYPFSLWPLPKFPAKDKEEPYEDFYNSKRLNNVLVQKNKR